MDDKNNKKKESIDEILSDLNGLLNKMPSILDGIKMPEMQPAESPKPAPAPEPQPPRPASEPESEAPKPETPAEPAAPEKIPAPAEPFDAEKTVVLESFAGLPEGSQAPGEISYSKEPEPASPRPEALASVEADKNSAAPEPEKLDVQSLGDFMFGQEAEPEKPAAAGPVKLSGLPLEPPAEEPIRNVSEGPSLSVSEFTPPAPEEQAPAAEIPATESPAAEAQAAGSPAPEAAAVPEAGLPGIPEPAPDQMFFSPAAEAGPSGDKPPAEAGFDGSGEQGGSSSMPLSGDGSEGQYGSSSMPLSGDETGSGEKESLETSRDFGIPDIDALMQISEGEKPAAEPARSGPETGLNQESVQAAQEAEGGLSMPAPDGALPEQEPQRPAEPPAAMESGEFIIEPGPKQETPFDAFTIEPSSPDAAPAQDGGETLRLDPPPESPGQGTPEQQPSEPQGLQFEPFAEPVPEPKLEAGEGLQPETRVQPETEPKLETGEGIQLGNFAEPEAEPKLEVGEGIQPGNPAEPESEPKLEVGQGIQLGAAQEPAPGIELAPAIELGADGPSQPANPDETLPGNPPSQSFSGEETLVVAPQEQPSGEEEKTVIFQASPDTTTRAQAKDLGTLSAKQSPEGIPPERLRSVVFLYSPGDEALCATVLAELDAICLKSASKPMFVKRAYVKPCDVDSNANFVHQSVVDSGAIGLVCVGAVPQEKLYEIENAFTSAGGFFRHFDASSFNHSSALDLVADLIVR